MNQKELNHFRELLLQERRRVLEELGWIEENYIGKSQADTAGEVSTYSIHPADQATDAYERETAYLIESTGTKLLDEIDDALRRIDEGKYGICENCGEEIPKERLEAIPYARLCVKCQAELEARGAGVSWNQP